MVDKQVQAIASDALVGRGRYEYDAADSPSVSHFVVPAAENIKVCRKLSGQFVHKTLQIAMNGYGLFGQEDASD